MMMFCQEFSKARDYVSFQRKLIGVNLSAFFSKYAVIASASEAIKHEIYTKSELDRFARARNDDTPCVQPLKLMPMSFRWNDTSYAEEATMTSSHPLIIIGSGLAGYMLAKELRKLDAQTPLIIITADDGAFYSKPLLSTALTQRKTPEQLVVTAAPIHG